MVFIKWVIVSVAEFETPQSLQGREMLESTTRRVLVVGGGVTGSMLARHLIQASKWEVSPPWRRRGRAKAEERVKKREARGVASSGPRPRCVDQPNARGRCWMRGTVLVAERRGSRMPARRSRAPARCTVPVCAFTQSEHFTNTRHLHIIRTHTPPTHATCTPL